MRQRTAKRTKWRYFIHSIKRNVLLNKDSEIRIRFWDTKNSIGLSDSLLLVLETDSGHMDGVHDNDEPLSSFLQLDANVLYGEN